MERIYKQAKEQIHRNAERVENGLFNYIPFGLPRFEDSIPGIQRKNYVIITANSGIGKSRLAKCLYVIRPVDFVMKHPELKIKLKIPYFCLEESKVSFIQSIYCYKLYELYGMRVPIKMLNSITGRRALPREIREKVDALDGYMEQFEEYVEVIDDIRYPYGIFSHVEQYMEANGTWSKKVVPRWDKLRNEMVATEVNDIFKPYNPDTYCIPVTDHVAKLYPPKGKTLHETIGTFSSMYNCELRDRYQCSPVAVQQQASDQEKKQFTYSGQSIISKLEPSLDGLGDNKMTQRDADEIIGIFSPSRHEIPEHRRYKVNILDDNYRSLIQLKARDGYPNTRIGLYFDGGVYYVEEFPPASEMTPELYEHYLRKAGRSAAAPEQATFNFGD